MMEEEDSFDDVFRLSSMSIASVDEGLAGLEIKETQSMCEWVTSCCCPCLAPKKPKKKNKGQKTIPTSTLMLQELPKTSTDNNTNGASTVELRSSFHFSSEDVAEEVGDLDIDPELNTDIVAWEEELAAYDALEESLSDKIPFIIVKDIRNDPSQFISAEDVDVATLAAARFALLKISPDSNFNPQPHDARSQASLTRFMSSSVDSASGSVQSASGGRGRSGTLNPLHEHEEENDEDGHLEAVDEVVSSTQGSRERTTFGQSGLIGRVTEGSVIASDRLSKRWAGHLSEIAPTQGKMSKQVGHDGAVVLKVRPKWPDWLIDTVFEVVKTNKYGRRQNRQLKLTKYHIVNIKDGKKVTRLHKYSALKHAYLVRPTTFVLEFFDESANPPLFYESMVAGQIVQQLSTRVQVRSALEDVSLDAFDMHGFNKSMGFSVKATSSMVEVISSDKYNRESNVLDFARSLGSLATPICESVGITVIESKLNKESQDKIYISLTNVERDSREYHVKQAVESLILNKSGPAGNTTNHFIEKFRSDPSGTELVEVRHFIDGMHEYILETNIAELVAVLHGTAPPNRGSTLSKEEGVKETVTELEQDDVAVVSFITFTVVEEAVFYPLQEIMSTHFFSDPDVLENELKLVQKMQVLAERHQHEWSIAQQHQSPAAWSSAIFELAGIERNPTPSMRLQALVHTAKAIYSEFRCEILPILRMEKGDNFKESDAALGADDFLPIFIFVVCRAGLTHPSLSKDMLWQLCHPDQLHGESGYYLTVYESALEYIACEEVSEERMTLTGVDLNFVTSHNTKLTQVPDNPVRRMTLL